MVAAARPLENSRVCSEIEDWTLNTHAPDWDMLVPFLCEWTLSKFDAGLRMSLAQYALGSNIEFSHFASRLQFPDQQHGDSPQLQALVHPLPVPSRSPESQLSTG